MFCRKCGAKLPEDAAFCNQCGEKVADGMDANSSQKQHIPMAVWIALGIACVAIASFVIVFVVCTRFIFTNKTANETTVVSEVKDDAMTNETDQDVPTPESDGQSDAGADEPEEEGGFEPSEEARSDEELIDAYYDSMKTISIDGLSYKHVQDPDGGCYYCNGLEKTEGSVWNTLYDLDGDGVFEIIDFALHYNDEDGFPTHEMFLAIWDVRDGQVVKADEMCVGYMFGGTYDEGDFRFMMYDGKYLCIDSSDYCFLEGDGSGVDMNVFLYDGTSLLKQAAAGFAGSDWSDAWESGRDFAAIGMTRTAELLEKGFLNFSTADSGFEPMFKVHAGINGEFDDPVLTTVVSLVLAEPSTDYLIVDSSWREIIGTELSRFSKEQLRLARNEIYARYGWNFEDKQLQAYFNGKVWYRPSVGVGNITDNDLTQTEKANRDTIVAAEK